MEKSDAELVRAYLAGDEAAFATLLQRHLKSVYSFTVRSVGDEAEDIVQDTFLKAWKNLRTYDPEQAQFKTWLMRIARNTVIDFLRKKRPHTFSEIESDHEEHFAKNIPDSELLPDELVARAHETRDLDIALESLSVSQREVILLHYMDHMTFDDIAQVLGESSSTVRSRARRGLLQLREHLLTMQQK